MITYLIFAYFPLFNTPKSRFIHISFFLSSIFSLSFSILFNYLHFLNIFSILKCILANIFHNAYSFILLYFFSRKTLSLTDFIILFNISKFLFTYLYSSFNFSFSTNFIHLKYILFLFPIVTYSNFITLLFFCICPYYN